MEVVTLKDRHDNGPDGDDRGIIAAVEADSAQNVSNGSKKNLPSCKAEISSLPQEWYNELLDLRCGGHSKLNVAGFQ